MGNPVASTDSRRVKALKRDMRTVIAATDEQLMAVVEARRRCVKAVVEIAATTNALVQLRDELVRAVTT